MALPAALVNALAGRIYAALDVSELGHCVRVDNLTGEDCVALWQVMHDLSPDVAVHILGDDNASDGSRIKAERAVELRNRKAVRFGLLVPSGLGTSGPSSLTNSFAPFDLDSAFAEIAKDLLTQLPDELRLAVMQVRYGARGVLAPSAEQWVAYVAAVAAQPTFVQAGAELWHVGLIPDGGGDSFPGRLEANRRCTVELTRPVRAHSSPSERLAACRLEPSPVRRDLLTFLTNQGAQLRLGTGWLRRLAEPGWLGQLSFEQWPLTEGQESNLRSIVLVPFVGADGTVAKGTKLHQSEPGAMPFAKIGPKEVVIVSWQPVPKTPVGVGRWRAELIPSRDEISPDELGALELPSSKVSSSTRRTSIGLDLDPDVLPTTVMQVRVTALDESGSEVRDETGSPVEALSQEFLLNSDADLDGNGDSRAARQRAQSLPYGRLAAAVELPLVSMEEDSVIWTDGDPVEFGLRVGARRTLRIEFSPVLKQLQELVLTQPTSAGTFQTETEIGERIDLDALSNDMLPLPDVVDSFAARRRELFGLLQSRHPRHLIEVAAWDVQLRRRARSYVSAYRKALEAADPELICRLLRVDTLELRIAHQHGTHRAIVVLPTHPLRVAWMAVYDELLGGWAEKMLDMPSAERQALVGLDLVARLAPLNIPTMVPTSEGALFLFHQNLQFLTGLYVDPADRLASRTAAAVAEAVGIKATAVGAQVPPKVLADRIRLFRSCHPYVDALRLVAVNPGPGVLVAASLRDTFAQPKEEEAAAFQAPPRCDVIAFDHSAAEPAPIPALRAWQDELYGQQPRGRHSFLTPLLTLTVRPPEELRDGPPVSAHLAIVTDVGAPKVALGERVPGGDSTSCFGLLARQLSAFTASEGGLEWRSQFRFGAPRTSAGPALSGELSEAQQATIVALCRAIGGDPEHEAVEIRTTLGPDELSNIEALHASADWVVTVDRYLGLEAFDSPGDAHLGARSRKYVLDHAPDFLDGVGHRLSITTAQRAELELVLARAMEELGFGLIKETVGSVLDDLRTVSGRLALRVLGDDAHAREAVGLGVVVAYLRAAGQLEDTILVPVDAHPELFGPAARLPLQGSRRTRCDLIAVRFTARTLQMEFIEVKSRSAGAQLEPLYEQITDQCAATEDLIRDLFFRTDPARMDHVLQRARLANILRHYLHRAYRNGLIQSHRAFAELADQLYRLETGFAELKSIRNGYVVTLDGKPQAKVERRGTTIRLLTTAELHGAGFNSLHNALPSDHSCGSESDGPGSPRQADREQAHVDASQSAGHGGVDSIPAPSTLERAEDEMATEEGIEPRGDGSIVVELGTIAGSGDALSWRISVTGSPHLFILGIPGQGKSVTVQRLLRAFAAQDLPVLVVDFHGQFGAGTAFSHLRVLDVADGLPFSPFEADAGKGATGWQTTSYAVAEIFQYLCDLGDIQRDVVYTALKRCYENGGFTRDSVGMIPTIGQFSEALEAAEAERKIKNVVPRCRPLLDFGLFRDEPDMDLANIIRDGMVVDVHNVGLETVQQAAGAFVLRKVYRDMFRWGETDRLRLAIVLDEAHRLARDVTLPKLMKEGRKFGIVVVVASQGLDDFHRDVVGNAGTKIVFRTNFPQSKRAAQFLRGRAGTDIAAVIEQLGVGQAVVSTPALEIARRVLMYPLDAP